VKRTNLFGISALMVIMISCVCIAQPNMTATESLIQNAGVISTESAGMNALDVIHEVDGTEVAGKLTAFDGEKFALEIEGEIKEISRAEVVYISLGQQQPRPKLLYVGSDTDDLANAAVAEALEKAGFDLTSATRLPASLEGFDVVVLESVSASSSDAANMLRSFVGKGGGAVLIGSVPKSLCPEGKRDYYWNDNMK